MPVTDALLKLHGTPTTPANIFTSTSATGNPGDTVIDFGAPVAGTSYPWIEAFPSLTEKGYTFPPEIPGAGGIELGIHLIITTACTVGAGMTAGNLIASTGAADTLGTTIGSRTFTLAQLAVLGAHYFVPVMGSSVLEFLGCYFQATTQVAGAGAGYAWFGPRCGGEQ